MGKRTTTAVLPRDKSVFEANKAGYFVLAGFLFGGYFGYSLANLQNEGPNGLISSNTPAQQAPAAPASGK